MFVFCRHPNNQGLSFSCTKFSPELLKLSKNLFLISSKNLWFFVGSSSIYMGEALYSRHAGKYDDNFRNMLKNRRFLARQKPCFWAKLSKSTKNFPCRYNAETCTKTLQSQESYCFWAIASVFRKEYFGLILNMAVLSLFRDEYRKCLYRSTSYNQQNGWR